ncbi:MAG: hypothetical protein ACK5OB_04355 [Pirellula sp.]
MKSTIILGCTILVAGCQRAAQVSQPAESRAVTILSSNGLVKRPPITEWSKVKIGRAGEVFVNKQPMSAANFATECARLRKIGGAILLFVDAPDHVANPAQAQVLCKIEDEGVTMKVAMEESELE